jgi:serine/threonine protein kinase
LENTINWGLYEVLQGISFLHSKSLFHGNLNIDSIFVTKAGGFIINKIKKTGELEN